MGAIEPAVSLSNVNSGVGRVLAFINSRKWRETERYESEFNYGSLQDHIVLNKSKIVLIITDTKGSRPVGLRMCEWDW